MTQAEATGPRGPRRAGRRKVQVLEAAGRVIAERGADATRFADVAAESAVPVSTLQYYFGSREDSPGRRVPARLQHRDRGPGGRTRCAG